MNTGPRISPNHRNRSEIGGFKDSGFRYVLLGARGAGSRWHVDPRGTDAWNALLAGRKLWAFAAARPPGVSLVPRLVTARATVWTTAPSAREWFAGARRGVSTVLEQRPGDVVYVPAGAWHATVCEAPCVAVTENVVHAGNARRACRALAPSEPALARALAARVLAERG